MYFNLRLVLCMLLMHTGYNAYTQVFYSTENLLSSNKPTFSHQYRFIENDTYYFIDTSFSNLKWYHQWNNAHQDLFDYSVLSNMGGALNPLNLVTDNDIWNYYPLKAYQLYFTKEGEIPLYYTRSPLTEASYWMGYDRGQNFKIYHTQNVNEHWNFLIRYKRLNSLGFYNHNRNKQSNFLANTHYDNPDWGYRAVAYFLSEKLEVEEWGGLANDSLFTNNLQDSRILLDVNLPDDNRVMRNREFYLDQRIKFGRLIRSDEKNDSINDPAGEKEEKAFAALGHSFKYSRRSDVYRGNLNSGFYRNYFSTNDTYTDSSSYVAFTNTFYVEAEIGTKNVLGVKGGVRNLITEYEGPNYSLTTQNWGLTGGLKGVINERVDVRGKVDYILTGPLRESLLLAGEGKVKVWRKFNAKASYTLQLRYPTFFEQFYYSTNFIWNNAFEKELRNTLTYGLYWNNNGKLEATNHILSNFTYYGAEGAPAQANEPITVTKLSLNQDFIFWNWLHLDSKVYYQTTTNAEDALPLPEWVSRNALYFEFPLFKGALKCLLGSEVKYFSEYDSPSFNPATGEFFVENARSIGNYPLIDLFANFKIKKAKVFVKLEHFNQGLLDYTYFAAPEYPFPDRILRLGISWRFFN